MPRQPKQRPTEAQMQWEALQDVKESLRGCIGELTMTAVQLNPHILTADPVRRVLEAAHAASRPTERPVAEA